MHYSSPMGVDEFSKSRFCSYTFTIVFDSWSVHIESFFGFFDPFVLTLWGTLGHVEVRMNSTTHIKIQTFVDWIDSQIEMNHDTSIYVPVESSTMYCCCNDPLEVWHSWVEMSLRIRFVQFGPKRWQKKEKEKRKTEIYNEPLPRCFLSKRAQSDTVATLIMV